MEIGEIRNLAGPNVYSHQPVLVMPLGLGELYGKESCDIPGFVDRLLTTLPGVQEHHCGLGRRGGFVERLREGTYFGHVVEHVALELTDAVGISVNRGKTVEDQHPGWYLVAVEYRSEKGMRELLRIAVQLVEALIEGRAYALEDQLAEIHRLVEHNELGPSTKAIVDAAIRRNIPCTRVDENSLARLGYGIHSRYVQATIAHNTRLIAAEIASDKQLTKQLLSQSALPVPQGRVVATDEKAIQAFKELAKPVVAKPLDGNQGKGVSLNLTTPEQVSEAFRLAQEFSRKVIIEEMFRGRD